MMSTEMICKSLNLKMSDFLGLFLSVIATSVQNIFEC